jgi:hypothetical protein
MKAILSIHVKESKSVIYYKDGEYRTSVILPISDLSIEQAAIRQAAMDWFTAQINPGENLISAIILDINRNAILADPGNNGDPDNPEGNPPVPPTYRHEVIGVVTVRSTSGRRVISRSSENMPTELRNSFLALLAGIEAKINQPQLES